jgi:Trk K+ transport system NAD-binding subunit
VTFLDSNPQSCRRAEEAGFAVVFGDAMREQSMLRARPETVGSAVGLTANQTLNNLFVSRMRERYGVPAGYVAASDADAGLTPELVASKAAVVLFEGAHDVERWDVRSRHGEMEVEHWIYGGEPEPTEEPEDTNGAVPPIRERLVILAIRRGESATPMHDRFTLKAEDVASVAIHLPDREEAHAILEQRGWRPYPLPDASEA